MNQATTILTRAAFRKVSESKAFLDEAKEMGIVVKFMGSAQTEAHVKESIKEVEALKDLLK